MLNKQEILKNYTKDDKIFLSTILDKIEKNIEKNITISTSFLDMHEFKLVMSMVNKFNVKHKVFNISDLLERKVIVFLSDYEDEQYYLFDEIVCLKMIPKTKNKLKHKDYMGTIYNLGININKIGDIFVLDDICYLFTFKNIYEYIKLNLEKVGNVKVEIDNIKKDDINLTRIYEENTLNVPSLRIDIILAHLYKISRNDTDKKITKGELIVNSVKTISKTKEIKDNDIISFRGLGKFKIVNFDINKKGKYIVKILIYK